MFVRLGFIGYLFPLHRFLRLLDLLRFGNRGVLVFGVDLLGLFHVDLVVGEHFLIGINETSPLLALFLHLADSNCRGLDAGAAQDFLLVLEIGRGCCLGQFLLEELLLRWLLGCFGWFGSGRSLVGGGFGGFWRFRRIGGRGVISRA